MTDSAGFSDYRNLLWRGYSEAKMEVRLTANYQKLLPPTLTKLDSMIDSISFLETDQAEITDFNGQLSFQELKTDYGRAGLESVLKEVNKLRKIQSGS